MQHRCLSFLALGAALLASPFLAQAFPLKPITIFGDPVAPPILDQDGNGFCVTSEQANTGEFILQNGVNEQFVFDAGSIFGNEFYITTPSPNFFPDHAMTFRYPPIPYNGNNFVSKGANFSIFLNAFLDHLYYPSGVFTPISTGKMNWFFDLSNRPNGTDPNGDFVNGNPPAVCPPLGCPFPAIPNLPNFPIRLSGDQLFADPQLKQAFPDVSNFDQIHRTAERFRGFLNIKPELTNREICFGIYADDGAALTISDSNAQHYILSATSNRCEACTPNVMCPTPGGCVCRSSSPPSASAPGGPLLCTPDTNAKNWCETCDHVRTGQRWRMANCVRFMKPGMYPIEILHVSFGGNNALEVATKLGDPNDFSDAAFVKSRCKSDQDCGPGGICEKNCSVGGVCDEFGTCPIHQNWGAPTATIPDPTATYDSTCLNCPYPLSQTLSSLGFKLLDPKWIFQSTTGFDIGCNLGQCPWRKPSDPDFGKGCGAGNFCNEAGNCEPCDEKSHCGLGCVLCAEVNFTNCDKVKDQYQCVQCRKNSDCLSGQTCDQSDHICHCQSDPDCPKGQTCQNKVCKPCKTDNACAGNSCSCCRSGLKCFTDPSRPDAPSCVECTSIADCTQDNNQTCDLQNHRCVTRTSTCNSNDRCGNSCTACPKNQPFCLDGRVCVECRNDMDCPGAEYCLSGQCVPCDSERRCGSSCRACPASAPFCDAHSGAESAVCVGCFKDEQCGTSGKCDTKTGQCQTPCNVTCPANLICDDTRCIQCRSSVQCGCGQSCNPDTGSCEKRVGVGIGNVENGGPDVGTGTGGGGGPDNGGVCQSTLDCQGDECCIDTQQCKIGHCNPLLSVHGGALCACNITGTIAGPHDASATATPTGAWLWLGLMVGTILLLGSVPYYRHFFRPTPVKT